MRVTQSRITSREGVNAVQAFFESNGCVFQEVAQQNDFGKDAYIDIVRNGVVTPLCIAVQIKSGESYRTPSGDYLLPIEGHASNWRRSTIPVFGVVYDPTDQLLRWADLTGYLQATPEQEDGSISVPRQAVLTAYGLGHLVSAASKYVSPLGQAAIALQLLASTDELQTDAIFDAWALGRHDARHLILLRRLVMDLRRRALRTAIHLLSHAGSHPDILWTPTNWIPPEIEKQVLPSFRWSVEEIAHMLQAIDSEEWGRGTLGQSFDVLMYEDPGIVSKFRGAVQLLLDRDDELAAIRAASLALSHARDARAELFLLEQAYPRLATHEWFEAISAAVQHDGDFSLY